VIVSTPASAHAASNHPGEPTSRDDSADVMKIPDPIMDPTTIMVASSKLRPRMSLGGFVVTTRIYMICLTLVDSVT
jgi:hypothetical protein